MNSGKLIYLVWLLPAYLLFLTGHQLAVYYGIMHTYEEGTSYTAEIEEFEIKQIASQTNGYVILNFTPDEGGEIVKKLSLPVEIAGMIKDLTQVPVRYKADAFQEIVMMPTYRHHKNMVLSNLAMSAIGFLIALAIAGYAHWYVRSKQGDAEEELIIERIE